jgi:HEAT repeat protein
LRLCQSLQFEAVWTLGENAGADARFADFLVTSNAIGAFVHLLSKDYVSLNKLSKKAMGLDGPSGRGVSSAHAPSLDPADSAQNVDNAEVVDGDSEWSPNPDGTESDSVNNDINYRLSTREQAIWALGNIAGNSTKCRDAVIAAGTVNIVVHMLDTLGRRATSASALALVRNAAWLLSNLCRGRNPPDWTVIKKAVPQLAKLLSSDDEQICLDACWAISYLSDGDVYQVQAVIEAGVTLRLLELMKNTDAEVHTPALRAIGNLITGNDRQSQFVTEQPEVVGALKNLLTSPEKSSSKEAAWTLSNISAGTDAQLQMIIDAGVIPTVSEMLRTIETDVEVRRECIWVMSNAMDTARTHNNLPQVMYLLNQDAIGTMIVSMDSDDSKVRDIANTKSNLDRFR